MNTKIITALALIAIVTACKKQVGDTTLPAPSTGAKTTYVNVKPIIDVTCISCHNVSNKRGEYYDYNTVKNSVAKIISEIASGSMPKGSAKLSTAELNVIKQWQADGLLEK
jgi:hypothetical protein